MLRQRQAETDWLQKHADMLQPLVDKAMQVAGAAEMRARILVDVRLEISQRSRSGTLSALLKVLARVMLRRLGKFNAQSFASMPWLLAKARHSDKKLFVV